MDQRISTHLLGTAKEVESFVSSFQLPQAVGNVMKWTSPTPKQY